MFAISVLQIGHYFFKLISMDIDKYSNEDFISYFEQLEKERQEFKNKYEENENFKKEIDDLTQKAFDNKFPILGTKTV